jgi:hypothetical protein
LQKLINIAMTHLTPPLDAFAPDTMELATKPATLATQVNEADAANVALTHTLGLSRPNWSLEMPQSELHG